MHVYAYVRQLTTQLTHSWKTCARFRIRWPLDNWWTTPNSSSGVFGTHSLICGFHGAQESARTNSMEPLLAQDGKAGLEATKHILMKIFKKTSDGDDLRKPSAFVSQCVKYAWHDLRPTTDRSKKRQSSSWNESPARCKKSRW